MSYVPVPPALMDTQYGLLDVPFRQALHVVATVISVHPDGKHAVADCGLKALSTDHGNPTIDGAKVWFCSDEHVTFKPDPDHPVRVGDRIRVTPSHVDPTMAIHGAVHLVAADGHTITATLPIDMRGW
jgi:D-threonine aldolase